MKKTYHIFASTKNAVLKDRIKKYLDGLDKDDLTVEVVAMDPDPTEEPGNYIVWYHSASHGKDRYYAGPPTAATGFKPAWTYDKKGAAKLSKKAAKLVSVRVLLLGYTTPMTIAKGGPDLAVIDGNKKEDKNV